MLQWSDWDHESFLNTPAQPTSVQCEKMTFAKTGEKIAVEQDPGSNYVSFKMYLATV